MNEPLPLSLSLRQALTEALEAAFQLVTGDLPIFPVAFIEYRSGEKTMEAFAGLDERGEYREYVDCVEMAKKFIDDERERIQRYVVVWEELITKDGARRDAVLAEGGEGGSEVAVLVFRAYRMKGLFKKKAVPDGNPVILERLVSRLETPA